MNLKQAFGQVIRDARKAAHKTQEDLAHEAQMSVAALSWIERGVNAPNAHSLFLIAKALDLAPHEIVHRVEVLSPDIC